MAFLAARNASLDQRHADIAVHYMRHGEELGIRWDYAFYQMIVETGSLAYKRGNGRPGDVKPSQNNFAGLGATGNGEPGESFPSVAAGVKAHLQHVLMYSGERINDPVAERTRKVQEWGVLTSWQKGFKRPITFSDLGRKWAPGDNSYSAGLETTARKFNEDFCNKADPRPELVTAARGQSARTTVADAPNAQDKPSGADLARQAIERGRAEGDGNRRSLGARPSSPAATTPAAISPAAPPPAASHVTAAVSTTGLKILNAPRVEATETPIQSTQQPQATVQTAAATTSAKPAAAAPAATAQKAPGKCRVWTASYGGQKSVIIRSTSDQYTNFTVLDVNEGQEGREADAYIAAYAKGGSRIAEFANQNAALEKAFVLCPEG